MSGLSHFKKIQITVLLGLFLSLPASALSSGISYHGRLLSPDGVTPVSGIVQFKIQIRTPDSSNCLLYEEWQSQDLTSTNGVFALTINDGTATYHNPASLTLDTVFANRGTLTFSPSLCVGSNVYAPNVGDGRNLVVTFQSATMTSEEMMPLQTLNFAPLAIEAKQVSGFQAENLLRFQKSDGTLVNTSPLNDTEYAALVALVDGASTLYAKAGSATNGTSIYTMPGTISSSTVGNMWLDTTGGVDSLKINTDSGVQSVLLLPSATATIDPARLPASASTWAVNGSTISNTNAGNVGIGTSSPTQALDVTGFIRSSQGGLIISNSNSSNGVSVTNNATTGTLYPGMYIKNYYGTGTGNPIFTFFNYGGSSTAPAPVASGHRIGKIDFQGGYDTASSASSTSAIEVDASESFSSTARGSQMIFSTTPNGTTTSVVHMTINNAGNVGIGTTPGYKLDVAGQIHTSTGGIVFPDNSTQTFASDAQGTMIAWDQEPINTAAPDVNVAGTWVTRTLNTVNYNSITGASLATNQITLPAGTYLIDAHAPSSNGYYHQAILFNVTDGTTDLLGSSEKAVNAQTNSDILGAITLTAAKTYEIRHRATNAGAGYFGYADSYGPGIFTRIRIQKLK